MPPHHPAAILPGRGRRLWAGGWAGAAPCNAGRWVGGCCNPANASSWHNHRVRARAGFTPAGCRGRAASRRLAWHLQAFLLGALPVCSLSCWRQRQPRQVAWQPSCPHSCGRGALKRWAGWGATRHRGLAASSGVTHGLRCSGKNDSGCSRCRAQRACVGQGWPHHLARGLRRAPGVLYHRWLFVLQHGAWHKGSGRGAWQHRTLSKGLGKPSAWPSAAICACTAGGRRGPGGRGQAAHRLAVQAVHQKRPGSQPSRPSRPSATWQQQRRRRRRSRRQPGRDRRRQQRRQRQRQRQRQP